MEKESWETKAFELVNKYDVATKILNTNITISPKHLKTIFKTIRQGVETMNPIDDEEKEKIRTQAKKELSDELIPYLDLGYKEEAMKIIPYFNEQKVLYGMTGVLSGHKYKILTFEKMSEKGTIKFKIEDQRSEYPCNSIKII